MDGRNRAKKDLTEMRKFIQRDLRKKIIEDLKAFRISSEADLCSSITYHLRKKFNLNPSSSKYRLATGLRVRRQSTGKAQKNEVDVVIQYLPGKNWGRYLPRIMIEVKEKKSLSRAVLMEDVKKFRKFRKKWKASFGTGFIIFLCRVKAKGDKSHKDKYLQDKAENWMNSKHDSRTVPIIINAYDNMSKARGDLFDTRWEQSSDYQKKMETASKAAATRKKRKR